MSRLLVNSSSMLMHGHSLFILSLLFPRLLSFSPSRFARTLFTADGKYDYLEDVDSAASLNFARKWNAATIAANGDPEQSPTYSSVLKILESKEKVPHAYKVGYTYVYNLWQDATNKRGLWRRTHYSTFADASNHGDSKDMQWETVLDLDKLNEKEGKSWVWK